MVGGSSGQASTPLASERQPSVTACKTHAVQAGGHSLSLASEWPSAHLLLDGGPHLPVVQQALGRGQPHKQIAKLGGLRQDGCDGSRAALFTSLCGLVTTLCAHQQPAASMAFELFMHAALCRHPQRRFIATHLRCIHARPLRNLYQLLC